MHSKNRVFRRENEDIASFSHTKVRLCICGDPLQRSRTKRLRTCQSHDVEFPPVTMQVENARRSFVQLERSVAQWRHISGVNKQAKLPNFRIGTRDLHDKNYASDNDSQDPCTRPERISPQTSDASCGPVRRTQAAAEAIDRAPKDARECVPFAREPAERRGGHEHACVRACMPMNQLSFLCVYVSP